MLTLIVVMVSSADPARASLPGEATVIEHLRLHVPQSQQSAWLEAERTDLATLASQARVASWAGISTGTGNGRRG